MTSGLAGQTLGNRYALDSEVRAEGVATTYSATDLECNATTVLAKVLDLGMASDAEVERFDRSGAVLKPLKRQPWSPRLIERATDTRLEYRYLIFENMNGKTLAEHLKEHRSLPISDTLAIAIDITAVLEELHARGLMHGDLRPIHVFLEEDPRRIRLLSFDRIVPTDLVHLRSAELSEPQVPSRLEAPYWPPARLKQPADVRYDLYALAAVIYEMVGGLRLSSLPLKYRALKPVDIVLADPSIDPGMRDFLVEALNPDIAEQFQSAREMSVALKELLQTRALTPEEPPKPTKEPGSQRRVNVHPNDVELVRVYPREKGGSIFEETIPSDAEFEIVVEAKAGETIHAFGAEYFLQIVVRDLTDFEVVCEDHLKGNFSDKWWNEPVLSHEFPIPAQGAGKANHIYEVLASLHVGITNPNVTFAKSPMFIIFKA